MLRLGVLEFRFGSANLVGPGSGVATNTGATHHVCLDKKMFSTFELVETREKVFIGNFAIS